MRDLASRPARRAAARLRLALPFLAALLAAGCASGPPPAPSEPPFRAAPAPDADAGARCDACRAPLAAGQAVRWPDGRLSCARCAQDALLARDEALALLADARRELATRYRIDLGEVEVGLELADLDRLQAMAGAELAHPHLRAFTEVTEVLHQGRVTSRRFVIVLLRALPRACSLGIFCHELFHVAQTLTSGSEGERAFREGAAQYAQLRVYEARGGEAWARALRENPDPLYGPALRRFLALAAARGEQAAIELGLRETRFPPGS